MIYLTELADTLRKAREIVRKGWYQGSYTDGKGNYCALGALATAADCDWWQGCPSWPRKADRALTILARIVKDNGYPNVPEFNDRHGTAKGDVVALFDKALAELGALHEGEQ